jgi:hypothetical protein
MTFKSIAFSFITLKCSLQNLAVFLSGTIPVSRRFHIGTGPIQPLICYRREHQSSLNYSHIEFHIKSTVNSPTTHECDQSPNGRNKLYNKCVHVSNRKGWWLYEHFPAPFCFKFPAGTGDGSVTKSDTLRSDRPEFESWHGQGFCHMSILSRLNVSDLVPEFILRDWGNARTSFLRKASSRAISKQQFVCRVDSVLDSPWNSHSFVGFYDTWLKLLQVGYSL